MSNLFTIADLHFGHRNICKYRVEFESPNHHNQRICDLWQSVIKKNDTVYVLGDAAFDEEGVQLIRGLKGRKILIAGNHDYLPTEVYLRAFEEVKGFTRKKRLWLSHAPIHPQELRGRFNIHGHVHQNTLPDTRYFNACCEEVNYTPQPLDKIYKLLIERNPDYVKIK